MLQLLIACLTGGSFSFFMVFIFKLIRAKFPLKVICWFCDQPATVLFGNRNCWDCPSCEQYNGFTKEGDYNKPIPAQWTTELNRPISCKKQEFIGSSNGLCHACNERQLLKMQQLTAFKPFVESNYVDEVNDYKKHLEKIYRLCYKCNLHVHQELERQDLALKLRHSHYLSNNSLISSDSSSTSTSQSSSDDDPVKTVNQWCSHITGLLSCMLAVFLLFVHFGQIPSAFVYKIQLPTWALLMLGWLTAKNCGIAFSGLFLCLTSKFLWIGQKSLYPRDVICCFIWFLQCLLSVLITFGMVSSVFLSTLQSTIPLVSLISVVLNIFSSGCSRSTLSKKPFRASYCRSSTTSSLKSSLSSQPAESVQDFNCNDSLSSWHSSKTQQPSLSKLDSSSSAYLSSNFHRPFLRHRPPSSCFPLTKDSWPALSSKTNTLSFPLYHGTNLPSFKSLSQASLNRDLTSERFSSKSLFSKPLPRSSSFSLDNKSHLSPYFQRGPSSLNGSFTSRRDVSKKNTPSSLADNILGIKMNKISLGSAVSPSRKSMSDANLSCKSMPRSSSPVLTRGEIAPARLSIVKQGSDLHSSSRTYSDHNSLCNHSNYQDFLNDTASVHSDNFSVRSYTSRDGRLPDDLVENSFSSLNDMHLTSDTNQSEVNNMNNSEKSTSDTAKHTSDSPSKKTGYRRSLAALLIISVCINILLVALHMEIISLPDSISTYLSIIIISFKQFIKTLSLSSCFQKCITNVLSIFTI